MFLQSDYQSETHVCKEKPFLMERYRAFGGLQKHQQA